MNTASNFLNGLLHLTITLKPFDRIRDRPIQTMTFLAFVDGPYGMEVVTEIKYKTKGSTIPTTISRNVSISKAMEYLAQAAEQGYPDQESTAPTDPFFAAENIARIEANTEAVMEAAPEAVEEVQEEVPVEAEKEITLEDWQKPATDTKKKKKGNK